MLALLKKWYNMYFCKNTNECLLSKLPEIKYSREDLFDMLNLDDYPSAQCMGVYDSNKPTILIMDDIIDTYSLYEIDFTKMQIKYQRDIFAEFNVMVALGAEAGFIAYKYIAEKYPIDYAILDITIGSIMKFDNGEFLDIDGVDIGIAILKRGKSKVLFSTAHTLNRKNLVMEYYITKFEEYNGGDISKYSISKNGNRVEPIFNFLTS